MKRVCIGVHLYAEPDRLQATLASIRANTAGVYQLLLLADGPDEPTTARLATLAGLSQSATSDARGAAACFNRLATGSDADIVVFLESGAVVAPGWLGHCLAAFDAHPGNGLAGPSTNHCWNEQGLFPQSSGSADEVVRTSQEAALRFGGEAFTLEPLYSLADFCYVVRREVIEAIGGADEEYGLGPCWEMDYNIRAARAGWRGVWAAAAYVHRPPPTARRRFEESRRFETSRRLYQDRFCGARLRGVKSDYRSHCRGDACPNFAPPGLIASRRALQPPVTDAGRRIALDAPSGQPATGVLPSSSPEPLVSCIMLTCDRRSFVPQAIRCFLRQDYPHRELVVVDDGLEPVAGCVPDDPRIRYIRLDQKLTIGAKRNLACGHARGEFIVHWDDDDWYPPWRVSVQLRALLDPAVDICGTSRIFYYDAANDRAWEYKYGASGSAWVGGNTLAYRRSYWKENQFANLMIGEDALFVMTNPAARVRDLLEPALCVAMVHPGNTSVKETTAAFWHVRASAEIRAVLGDDRHFYSPRRPAAQTAQWPLVSCIMPTFNRRAFVPLALRYFLCQSYPNKELVIVDDGDDPVGDLARDLPGVRYIREPARISIGAKRNLACEHARGEIIAQWDDDDWYAPDRLQYQVAPILAGEADLTGLENSCVLELPQVDFWTTEADLHQQMFVGNVHGGTLVYSRQVLAQGLRYPEINLAEDAWLLHRAVGSGRRLLRLANPGVFVYVRHDSNAWRECAPGRFLNPDGWKRISPPPVIPEGIIAIYRGLNRLAGTVRGGAGLDDRQ